MAIRSKILSGFIVILLIFTATTLFVMQEVARSNAYSTYVAEKSAPAWDAIMEAKVEMVLGHLGLKELLAANPSYSKESVNEHLALSLWHVNALMQGGQRGTITYHAVTDTQFKSEVEGVVTDMKILLQTVNRRIDNFSDKSSVQGSVGDALEQLFGVQFDKVMADLTAAENRIAVIITTQNKEIQDYYESVKQTMILALLVVMIASFLIAGFIAHSISNPLRKMAEFIPRVAEGDYSGKIGVDSSDELKVMANAINRMVDKLAVLITKVQESGIQLSSSLTELAASTREQEATAAEHAASTSEVAASVKEISATSIELGKKMDEVNKLSHETALAATDGHALLAQMDMTMNQINEASKNITAKLAYLSDKTGNISKMVTTINKVADQTNLLSLNAAIEAEKAGEYGLGFSVVATEIRRLADQTAVATYDIEQVVAEVQSAVSAGVMSMDKFTDEIEKSIKDSSQASDQMAIIVDQVQSLVPHIDAVNEGLQVQLQGTGQISDVIMNLSEAAKHSAESAGETSDTIRDLYETARRLHEAAVIFELKDQ